MDKLFYPLFTFLFIYSKSLKINSFFASYEASGVSGENIYSAFILSSSIYHPFGIAAAGLIV